MLKNTKINNMPHYTIRTYCRFLHYYYSIMNYSWGTPSECLSLMASYAAVHSDLQLLSEDAFSVYNEHKKGRAKIGTSSLLADSCVLGCKRTFFPLFCRICNSATVNKREFTTRIVA